MAIGRWSISQGLLIDGLPAVEAACAEALDHGVHSADVVLNILARQREPAAPANIMTPVPFQCRLTPNFINDCLFVVEPGLERAFIVRREVGPGASRIRLT
jgi:hypothetical protein